MGSGLCPQVREERKRCWMCNRVWCLGGCPHGSAGIPRLRRVIGSLPQGAQPARMAHFPPTALWLFTQIGIALGCRRTPAAALLSQRPRFLLVSNYNLAQLERPEFLLPKPGRTHLSAGRAGSCCLSPFWVPLFTENKYGEVRGMPPPRRGHFASPGAAHTRACPSPGWGPLLGTSLYRDWGWDSRSRAERGGRGWAGGWHRLCSPQTPLLMGYVGC